MNEAKTHNKRRNSKIAKTLTLAIFLGVLVVGTYILITSRAGFDEGQIQVDVVSFPEDAEIKIGQQSIFDIVVTNNSQTNIEDIRIAVWLSDSLVFTEQETLTRKVFEPEDIQSGGQFKESITVHPVSTEEASVTVRVQYTPQDRKLRYTTNKTHDVVIGSLDAEIEVDLPESVFVDEEITGTISITPGSSLSQEDLLVRLKTPSDFEITSAKPEFQSKQTSSWELESTGPGLEQSFEFKGSSTRANSVDFEIEVGRFEGLAFRALSVHKKTVEVSHTPLLTNIEFLDGDNIGRSEDTISLSVSVSNRGDVDVEDLVVKIGIPETIVESGSFTSQYTNRVVAGKREIGHQQVPMLRSLAPSQEQSVEFSVRLRDFSLFTPSIEKQYEFTVEVSATADRRTITSEDTADLVIQGNTVLTQRVLRDSSLLNGQGPLPPEVDEDTSYIVVWELSNDINSLADTKVEASLPRWVDWRGVSVPSNEEIEYDPNGNTISWHVGSLESMQRLVHFEIWITPQDDHFDKRPTLMHSTVLTARNKATRNVVNQRIGSVTTALPDDPDISLQDSIVDD